MKQALKQGFGRYFLFNLNSYNHSLMNIFQQSDSGNKRRPTSTKNSTQRKLDSEFSNSSSIVTSQHMAVGQEQSQTSDQTQFSVSLEQQIRHGFFHHFKNPEDVYKYLVKVGTVLVVERDKITQLFKKIQQSYSELFYHSRLLYKESKDLELLKDFFRVRV